MDSSSHIKINYLYFRKASFDGTLFTFAPQVEQVQSKVVKVAELQAVFTEKVFNRLLLYS